MIRRLITDRDVALGLVASPIVLDGETLLTPAARDRAIALGLVIVERDGATLGAPAPAPTAYPFAGRATPGGAGCAAAPSAGTRAAGATSPSARAPGAAGSGSAAAQAACSRCGRRECAGACTGSDRCPAATAASRLPDGVYLVRVEGGRATSVLPATGPGVLAPPPR